jgi:hypothetical protein
MDVDSEAILKEIASLWCRAGCYFAHAAGFVQIAN